MKKPYYLQDEDCEPECVGFYENYNDVLNSAVDNGWSNEIGYETIVDEISEDMLEEFENDYYYDELVEYFKKKESK